MMVVCAAGCRPTTGRAAQLELPARDAARIDASVRPDAKVASTASERDSSGEVPGLDRLASASNRLGLDVYLSARSGSSNLVLSPLSISSALTMTWAGARGETALQMADVLHLEGTRAEVLASQAALLAWSRAQPGAGTFRMANRIFAERSFVFDPSYVRETTEIFGATLDGVDFVHGADAARRRINGWVSGETDNHIPDLIPPGTLTAATQLVLADAIYFLGAWAQPFDVGSTAAAPFHRTASLAAAVPTMHATEWASFAHHGDVRLLQLPYLGGRLTMTFVLPDSLDGVGDLESHLSSAMLGAWDRALSREYVEIALPRFVIRPAAPLALRPILAALGMRLAFDRASADFGGIAEPRTSGDRLYVGDVFHEAFVKVDEQGTEAAGATATVMRRSLAVRRKPEPQVFVADHPFLFLLRDSSSGMVIFIGRVEDPSAVVL